VNWQSQIFPDLRVGDFCPSSVFQLALNEGTTPTALRRHGTRMRGIFLLRVKGYSWEDVGAFLGMKANYAAVAYNEGVERARQRILRSRPGKSKPAAGGVR
jgi:hypothetical protein